MASDWAPENADAFDTNIQNTEWRPMLPDEFYDLLVVLAGNLYVHSPGEAAIAFAKFVKMLKPYNKPLMISEFGSMSLKGADVPDDKMGSEARHCNVLREAYESFGRVLGKTKQDSFP